MRHEEKLRSSDRVRPLFFETFWGNSAIGGASRCFQVAVLLLVPAGFVASRLYVSADSCVSDIKIVFATILALLVAHWVYFWMIDRPKVLFAFQRLLDSNRFEIRKVGHRYEFWREGHRDSSLTSTTLLSIAALYSGLIVFWCFGNFMLQRTCDGSLLGHPSVPVVLASTSLLLVILHEMLLWTCATRAVWAAQR
jgi:hypothetical protein